MVCNSDSDYLLHITGYGDTTSYIQIVPAFGPIAPFLNDLPDQHSITVGGYAGQPISIVPIDEPPNDSLNESPRVWVTLQTAVGATASCMLADPYSLLLFFFLFFFACQDRMFTGLTSKSLDYFM